MYKLYTSHRTGEVIGALKTNENESTICFLFDPDNTDYQAYLKWLDEGNEVLPADE